MDTSSVTLILAVGSIVMPILFGFIVYKMSTIFVTKEDWVEWKKSRVEHDHTFKEEIAKMEKKFDKLMDKIDNFIMNNK